MYSPQFKIAARSVPMNNYTVYLNGTGERVINSILESTDHNDSFNTTSSNQQHIQFLNTLVKRIRLILSGNKEKACSQQKANKDPSVITSAG